MSTKCPELESIRKVIDLYIEGVYKGSVETLQKAFHPQSTMFGWLGSDLYITPIQGLYDYIAATPIPAKSGEPTKFVISSIQVTGNAASVTLAMDTYHAHDFVDHFQLLKVEDRWWIICKLFQADPQSV